jgi:hypothetical protein
LRNQRLGAESQGSGQSGHPPLAYRGYRVYRGTCPPAAHSGAAITQELHESFQSWGGRCRFAALPVTNGAQSWFATVQAPPITTAPSILLSSGDGGDATDIAPSLSVHAVGDEGKVELLSAFEGWHDPVQRLIQGTSAIAVENAWGFRSALCMLFCAIIIQIL